MNTFLQTTTYTHSKLFWRPQYTRTIYLSKDDAKFSASVYIFCCWSQIFLFSPNDARRYTMRWWSLFILKHWWIYSVGNNDKIINVRKRLLCGGGGVGLINNKIIYNVMGTLFWRRLAANKRSEVRTTNFVNGGLKTTAQLCSFDLIHDHAIEQRGVIHILAVVSFVPPKFKSTTT